MLGFFGKILLYVYFFLAFRIDQKILNFCTGRETSARRSAIHVPGRRFHSFFPQSVDDVPNSLSAEFQVSTVF